MGSGIATALLLKNYTVILKEVNQNYLQAGIARIRGTGNPISSIRPGSFESICLSHDRFCAANLESNVKKGRMTQVTLEKTISSLKGVLDYNSFKDVDMVIEVIL